MNQPNRKRLYSAGMIDKDGGPNEDVIFEVALHTFSNIVSATIGGFYSAEKFKTFFKECEKSDCWLPFYSYIKKYLTVNNLTGSIEWDIINYDLTFCIYCYYFTEMVDMLDSLLASPPLNLLHGEVATWMI